jgi:hypothetical protein
MQKNRWIGTVVLCASAAAAMVSLLPFESLRRSLCLGIGIGLALVVPSFWSLSWALPRSDKIFYSVFVGGVFMRLSGLSVTAFVAYRSPGLSLVGVLMALVVSLIILSSIEMYFLQRQVKIAP